MNYEVDLGGASLRRMVDLAVPDPEAHAVASSRYTVEMIDVRLAELAGRTDRDALREIEYTKALRARKFSGVPVTVKEPAE